MNTTRVTILTALFTVTLGSLIIPSASARDAGTGLAFARHFDLVNATFDSVIAVAIAPADQKNFNDVALGEPQQGGLTSMTFDVPAGGCLRDLRVTFRGGRTQLFPHVDVCRSSGERLTARGGNTNRP